MDDQQSVNELETTLFHAHGALMGIVFVIFLPFGMILSRYKITKNWFFHHVMVQVMSLLVFLSGWAIAIYNDGVDQDYTQMSNLTVTHHSFGYIVFVGLISQLGLGIFRPVEPASPEAMWRKHMHVWKANGKEGPEPQMENMILAHSVQYNNYCKKRTPWKKTHRGMGVGTVCVAWMNVAMGLAMHDAPWYSILVVCFCMLLMIASVAYLEYKQVNRPQSRYGSKRFTIFGGKTADGSGSVAHLSLAPSQGDTESQLTQSSENISTNEGFVQMSL
eukprot:Clim_evm40s88 gene=Clim_evmTU40s88